MGWVAVITKSRDSWGYQQLALSRVILYGLNSRDSPAASKLRAEVKRLMWSEIGLVLAKMG